MTATPTVMPRLQDARPILPQLAGRSYGAAPTRFWRLAQALSALYPPGTEEKRWVDGVPARKKGLGF